MSRFPGRLLAPAEMLRFGGDSSAFLTIEDSAVADQRRAYQAWAQARYADATKPWPPAPGEGPHSAE